MRRFLLFFLAAVLIGGYAYARPQYSILQSFGTKCTGCHVNVQGGGARTNAGFLSRKDIALLSPETIGLGGAFNDLTNTVLNDMVTFGVDFRLQSAKWGPPQSAKRDWMVMQFSPFLAVTPVEWFTAEGFLNVGYFVEKEKRYGAQQPGAFSFIFRPSDILPQLRVGFFQPPIGQKWDDHTVLVRNVTNSEGRKPLIPDDYAEFGAQLDYEHISWLSLSAGLFAADKYAQLKLPAYRRINDVVDTTLFISPKSVSTALRGVVTPPEFMGITSFLGGTFFINRDFYISSLFVNFGKPGYFSVMTEYMRSQKQDSRLTMNFLVELTYQVTESVLPYVRLERGITKEVPVISSATGQIVNDTPYYVNQYVIGAHINPFPFLDILPEYRIFDRDDPKYPGTQNQWAVQLHVFY